MTKRQALNDLCKLYNLEIEVYSPGDGRSRYSIQEGKHLSNYFQGAGSH